MLSDNVYLEPSAQTIMENYMNQWFDKNNLITGKVSERRTCPLCQMHSAADGAPSWLMSNINDINNVFNDPCSARNALQSISDHQGEETRRKEYNKARDS